MANDHAATPDHSDMTPITAARSALALSIALTLSAVGVGVASAADYNEYDGVINQTSRHRCNALSPNIVDNTYSGAISTMQWLRNGQRGAVDVSISASLSIWGYDNIMTVVWTNLNTHRSGTLRGIQHTTAATGGSMYDFRDVRTGAGRVRIELRPVNRGPLLTLPAPSCSDVFVVK